MNTTYTRKDLVRFAQFVDDRAAKGMLFKDENGRNQISEELIDDWHVSLSVGNNYNCPKVELVTHRLLAIGSGVFLDRDDYEIGGITNIHLWASDNGVMIIAPYVEEINELCQILHTNDLVFSGSNNRRNEIKKMLEVKLTPTDDVPYIDAKFPHMRFPLYEGNKVVAIGIVVHETDF